MSSPRFTLKAISKGNHERYHTIADIDRAELIEGIGVNAKRIPRWLLPNSCLLVAGMELTDRHKIRPDIMLTEMSHLKLMRYNAEGMQHPELSTIISSRRPSGPRDGTGHDGERFEYLKGATQQTPDTGTRWGKKEIQLLTYPANACTTSQRLRCQADGSDIWTRRHCVSTGCRRPACTRDQYDVCGKYIEGHPPPTL